MWSYSGDPAASPIDAVRFLIGDTDDKDQQLQDEEIQYLIDIHVDPHTSAQAAARALAAKFARLADKEVGDLKLKLSQKAQNYATLVSTIAGNMASSTTGLAVPLADVDDSRFFTREIHSMGYYSDAYPDQLP